jgi:hypothetical protein
MKLKLSAKNLGIELLFVEGSSEAKVKYHGKEIFIDCGLLDSDFDITPKLETSKACEYHNISCVKYLPLTMNIEEAYARNIRITRKYRF